MGGMAYNRERYLKWLCHDGRIYRGDEIVAALRSGDLKLRRAGVQALYELASAERRRLIGDGKMPRWYADHALQHALATMWKGERDLLAEEEVWTDGVVAA